MAVHRFERGEQALTAFAVERADRASEAVDRLAEFVALHCVAARGVF
jgi:hypothetical protein